MDITVHFYLVYPISRQNSFDAVDNQHSRFINLGDIKDIAEMSDDDISFTGRIRRPQNRTSSRRRYLSTSVHDAIYLRRIRDHAQRLLDVLTTVELFLLMAGVAFSVAKKIGNLRVIRKLVPLLKLILSFIAL